MPCHNYTTEFLTITREIQPGAEMPILVECEAWRDGHYYEVDVVTTYDPNEEVIVLTDEEEEYVIETITTQLMEGTR